MTENPRAPLHTALALSLLPPVLLRSHWGPLATGPGHHVRLRLPPLPPPQFPGLLADPPPLHFSLHPGEDFRLWSRPLGCVKDVPREAMKAGTLVFHPLKVISSIHFSTSRYKDGNYRVGLSSRFDPIMWLLEDSLLSVVFLFFSSSSARLIHNPHRLPHTISFQFSTFEWLVFGFRGDFLYLKEELFFWRKFK